MKRQIAINKLLFSVICVLFSVILLFVVFSKPACVVAIKHIGGKERNLSSKYDNQVVKSCCEGYLLYGEGESDTEHIFAQSWAKKLKKKNICNDYYNLRTANKEANDYRGDKGFKTVAHTDDTKKEFGYIEGDWFEPFDEYKGDIARTLLYVYYNYDLTEKDVKDYFSVSEMIKWAKSDKVSPEERKFAENVYKKKGYKNLFIISPDIVNAIA